MRAIASAGQVLWVGMDSQSLVIALEAGRQVQASRLGRQVWVLLDRMAGRGVQVRLQWLPSHCGVPGNEHADKLAELGSQMPQQVAPRLRHHGPR